MYKQRSGGDDEVHILSESEINFYNKKQYNDLLFLLCENNDMNI